MNLEQYIKPKPKFIDILPIIGNKTAQAIYPFIFLPRNVYFDLLSDTPNFKNIYLLVHEIEHHKRQKQMGGLKFSLKYYIFPKFRFKEEMAAEKEAMKWLKKNNHSYDIKKYAKFFSGWIYFKPVSKDDAEKELEKMWKEA